jgi:hypothetical protein
MKKYVCPMGCLTEFQDQLGNCPECGMKLIPTDQYRFETDKNGYKMNKNLYKSVPYPHKSVVVINQKTANYLLNLFGH